MKTIGILSMFLFGWLTLFDSVGYYTVDEVPTTMVINGKSYDIKPEPKFICPADTSIIIDMPPLNKTFKCGGQNFRLKLGKILIWVD